MFLSGENVVVNHQPPVPGKISESIEVPNNAKIILNKLGLSCAKLRIIEMKIKKNWGHQNWSHQHYVIKIEVIKIEVIKIEVVKVEDIKIEVIKFEVIKSSKLR